MPRGVVRVGAFGLLFALLILPAHAMRSPFVDWAAIVVAGDHYDSDGNPSEGFDNARREVFRNLLRTGFSAANIDEFSVTPRKYGSEKLFATRPSTIGRALSHLVRQARSGCFLYFSSHGAPEGIIVGDWIVPPRALAEIVDHDCGVRPTVVILSACFSGVMLPALKAPNRMILTAARRNRTSFGCGQTDRYPYFDQCVLESWNEVTDFPALGHRAQACVAMREKREHLSPPSEPQLWMGSKALEDIPKWF